MTRPESRLSATVRAWSASTEADRDALVLLEAEGLVMRQAEAMYAGWLVAA